MIDQQVFTVIPLWRHEDHVTLKVFHPNGVDEYYFKLFEGDGTWTFENKDSGEEITLPEQTAVELLAMAKAFGETI